MENDEQDRMKGWEGKEEWTTEEIGRKKKRNWRKREKERERESKSIFHFPSL